MPKDILLPGIPHPADLGIETLETKRAAIDDRAALPQLGAKGLEQHSQLTMSLSSTDQP
jgi:hypothetical protein